MALTSQSRRDLSTITIETVVSIGNSSRTGVSYVPLTSHSRRDLSTITIETEVSTESFI